MTARTGEMRVESIEALVASYVSGTAFATGEAAAKRLDVILDGAGDLPSDALSRIVARIDDYLPHGCRDPEAMRTIRARLVGLVKDRQPHAIRQRAFDLAVAGLLAQGRQCYDARADLLRLVRHHGKETETRSPVGFLLGDFYSEALEGQFVVEQGGRPSLSLRRALLRAGFDVTADYKLRRLLLDLELVHDGEPEGWVRRLIFFRSEHGVDTRVVEDLVERRRALGQARAS
jgi:hypothetical protein